MGAEELFTSVAEALGGGDGITRARMFGAPGLKVRGKVFACLVKGELVVKLPRPRVDALVAAGEAERFDPGMGRLMKEWAAVPPAGDGAWLDLATEARDFVAAGR
jgi:TfoX/Sxy family transcriptional regulator of competence genes